jgi:Domain of unknown function (DUF4845)
MKRQSGVSLMAAFMVMVALALLAVTGMKLFPVIVEYYGVKKVLVTMENAGDTKGTVSEIRKAFDRRGLIDSISVIAGADLDITKDGGDTIVSAAWSVKVPLFANVSACIDFSASTAKTSF